MKELSFEVMLLIFLIQFQKCVESGPRYTEAFLGGHKVPTP